MHYRFVTLPVFCCSGAAIFDFWEAREGAKADVSCSMTVKEQKRQQGPGMARVRIYMIT
jgi:hypothetical protein